MTDKIELKIDFADFWPGFDKKNNFFYNLLSQKFTVIISDKPDLLFYSVYTTEHLNYKDCTKILYTGENQRPNFRLCDFAFSFDYSEDIKNYRLPLYALWGDLTQLVDRQIDARATLNSKKKFCCFIVSNGGCEVRNNFFHELSKYKHVDSGGRFLNNIGGPVENKSEFIKEYKFVISFENESYPGYTTEKVYEPLADHCIPIYWGNPLVGQDFNTKSFINCHDFSSFSDVIDKIKEVDNNDDLYMQYLKQPVLINNELDKLLSKENVLRRLEDIVAFHADGKYETRQRIQPFYLKLKGIERKMKSAKRKIKGIFS